MEPYTVLTFGGCTPEGREEVMQVLHDRLIEACPIRLGPVHWRLYHAEDASEILSGAGLLGHENAAGLLDFLRVVPGAELVVATVDVPDDPRPQ